MSKHSCNFCKHLEEDLEATEKNLKESSGFIEELLSGLKHRFPVQYADLEGDEYGDDAFSSHDLFELVIDPAVNAAQKAEAEVARLQQRVNELLSEELTDCAVRERIQLRFNMHEVLQQNERLTKMVDWLAGRCSEELGFSDSLFKERKATVNEWKEAARKAEGEGEETCQK